MIIRHALVLAILSSTAVAYAGDLSKEECVDAHSKGQDAKEQGKLSLARKLFLTCAQSSCPSLVQGDCARFADDLAQVQPTVSFVARDSAGADLPDTTVYVDDMLVVTRLDGKLHDLDPGTHAIKFANGGKEQVLTIVIGTGEKARPITATFVSAAAAIPATAASAPTKAEPAAKPTAPTTTHPRGARWLMIGGGALALVGGAFEYYGISKIPSNCQFSTRQCAAPPGDPSFAAASKGVKMIDYGLAVGGIGLAAVVTGVIWYVSSAKTSHETMVAAPFVTPTSAGVAVTVHL